MKKTKLLAPLALSAAVFAGGLLCNNSYADSSSLHILAYLDGVQCGIYLQGSTQHLVYNECDPSLGSYDAETETLTLGEGINGHDIRIHDSNDSGVITINATKSTTAIEGLHAYDMDVVFDLGDKTIESADSGWISSRGLGGEGGTITMNSGKLVGNTNGSQTKEVIVNGGELASNESTGAKTITIKGGKYKVSGGSAEGNFKISDGVVEAENGSITVTQSFELSGGEVSINNGSLNVGAASSVVSISGGKLTIDGQNKSKSYGIGQGDYGSTQSFTMTVSGGLINIKNVDYGIRSKGSSTKLYFNDGTTKIENAKEYAILLNTFTTGEKSIAIILGEGMGILEPGISIFSEKKYDYVNDRTGIIAPEVVTITKTSNIPSGPDGPDGSDTPDAPGGKDESDIKVPNTGAINSNEGGALAIFTATSFIILSVITMIGIHKKHTSGHFKYDK